MKTNLGNKLKELRKGKNISQEKFADFIGVSYQAVSKWENNITSPDILLLPEIARYFGISVDELLEVEQIDADKCFEEYRLKAEELFCNGKRLEIIPIWLEAYKKLPNDIRVQEMLMSTYFDSDRVKYQNEIIELGTQIYNDSEANSYYKGQAIREVAETYYANGNHLKASEWVEKAYQINHCQEILWMSILNEEKDLADTFSFFNHWYLENLFYMVMRLKEREVKCYGVDYLQKVEKAVADMFEVAYPNDDMPYESLLHLCILHRSIAEDETTLGNDEAIVKKHLTRAVECSIKSVGIKSHKLSSPLVCGWKVYDAPNENLEIVSGLKKVLKMDCFNKYRQTDWFVELLKKLEGYF